MKINRNEEALHVWERAVILNPLHSAAWSNTLVLLDGMGLHEKVLEVGQEALNKCSTSAAIHFTLGNTLGKLERWQEAEHHFQNAIELNRRNALYYSNFGKNLYIFKYIQTFSYLLSSKILCNKIT